MIVVVAMLKAVEGKGDALESEFKKLVPKVLCDQGTLAYVAHRGTGDPSRFFVYEKYEDAQALKAHSATPHFREFSRAVATILEGRPDVVVCREIV